MEPSKLFTLHYYFDLTPQASALSIFFAIFFITVLALRPYLRILAARHEEAKILRKLQKKHLSRLATLGVLGILTIGARLLAVPFLGMRFIAYALVIWAFYEIWQIVSVHKEKAHEMAKAGKMKAIEDKYLPHAKKKRKNKKK